jgi:hypothetical protein
MAELQLIGYTVSGGEAPDPVTARFLEILKAVSSP